MAAALQTFREFESARDPCPGIDFHIGDAGDLAFDDATFDAVISNFGILHLPRPKRFLEEALRVKSTQEASSER